VTLKMSFLTCSSTTASTTTLKIAPIK
jgi:hypothetical protein